MKTVQVQITGTSPLLMKADNIDWADKISKWEDDPKNKGLSVPGDDRSPAWRWIGCLYHNGEVVTIPSENLMSCMMLGGALVPVPGAKHGKTFKSQSQSGLLINDYQWPLRINNKIISMSDINALLDIESFAEQESLVKELGFSLFVKRARIGQSKHIRVRPRFDNWSIAGTITILDSQITKDILLAILEAGGRYKGLGDWRPGANKPGPFGMFEIQLNSTKTTAT
jgi:hypothetical protein